MDIEFAKAIMSDNYVEAKKIMFAEIENAVNNTVEFRNYHDEMTKLCSIKDAFSSVKQLTGDMR